MKFLTFMKKNKEFLLTFRKISLNTCQRSIDSVFGDFMLRNCNNLKKNIKVFSKNADIHGANY